MAEALRLLLMIHNTEISWVETALEDSRLLGGSLRVLASKKLDGGLEAPSVEAGRQLAEAALEVLPEHAQRDSIIIGLPSSWLEHLTLSTPKLRGLDELASLLREVTKRTSLPENDLLFAHRSIVADSSNKQEEISRLVVATREGPMIALIERLAIAGVGVSFVGSSCAALIANQPPSEVADDSGAVTPEIVFHLRRTGFAFALRIGAKLLQYRAASIEMPERPSELGVVIAEEVRRATIYFREKHRGRDVKHLRILGVRRGEEAVLEQSISQSSGLTVVIEPSDDPETVGREDALGLALEAGDPRSSFNLIPLDHSEARNRKKRLAPVAIAAALGFIGLVGFGFVMRQKTHDVDDAVAITRASLDTFSSVQSQHGALVSRLDTIERTRDVLSTLEASRIPLPRLVAALSSSVPAKCHILRVNCSASAAGNPHVQIVGMFVDSYWDLDSNVEQLKKSLGQRTGFAFHRTVEPDAARTREFQTFALESTLEPWNEPAGS